MKRNRYSRLIAVVLFLLSIFPLFAQSPTTTLDTYLTAVRQNQRPSAPQALWQNTEQHTAVLNTLPPYYTDTLSTVRAQAYYLAKQVGTHSQSPTIRQQAVSQLTSGLRDPDPALIGRVHSYLTVFGAADFNTAARQVITGLLSQASTHQAQLFKLIGTLNLTDQTATLQRLLPTLSARDRWAAQLALARLGDQEALATVLAQVKSQPLNDDMVYELLPDLVYTRQKEALDYLVAIIQSDEKRCQSADPEAEQNIRCGYRVLELLAPVVADFPLTLDESGDLAVSDYPKALEEVRAWLKEHEDYKVVR